MRTIWKYPVPLTPSFALLMPKDAKILTVQLQGGKPVLWALVENESEATYRHFRLYTTGEILDAPSGLAIDAGRLRFVNCFQYHGFPRHHRDGSGLVYHLFQYEIGS